MKKFVKYTRVSTREQGGSGLGLAGQSRHIDEYVASIGGTCIEHFVEVLTGDFKEDISGSVSLDSLLKPRQKFKEAIAFAKKEGATLIAHEQSRLTRSPLVFEFLIHNKLDLITSSAPNDTIFIMRVKCALSADELCKIGTRTKMALAERKIQLKEKGFFISKAGNKITKLGRNNFKPRVSAVNEQSKKLSGYIQSLRLNGFSLEKIAERLNQEGHTSPRGAALQKGTISRMLKMA